MKKIHFSVFINAPREKVWNTIIDDKTYRLWTAPFSPDAGSYYEGEWKEGSDMKFLGPNEDGTVSGMYATLRSVKPPEYLSIEHKGEIIKGEKKPWPQQKEGEFAQENYTLIEKNGGTELQIDLDTVEEYEDMFKDMWPKALTELKKLAEQ